MDEMTTLPLPADPEEAVRVLRAELRAARRRRTLARDHRALALYRELPLAPAVRTRAVRD